MAPTNAIAGPEVHDRGIMQLAPELTIDGPQQDGYSLKARAVELVIHAQADPNTANGAIARVAKELGVSKEALRVWVRKHKDSGTATPADSVDLEAENRRLRAELAESKRANEILRRASAFFAAELDRPSK